MPIIYEPIPAYGPEHMPVEQFLKCVRSGAFTDYDGYGHSDIAVVPSKVCKMKMPGWATHVVWFNR